MRRFLLAVVLLFVVSVGGPFQVGPRTFGGILGASIANTAVWIAVVALAHLMARFFGGRIARR